MNLYLFAPGTVSAVAAPADGQWMQEPLTAIAGKLPVAEPDYTQFIPAMQLRRMSKAVRMGVAASRQCMEQSGLQKPDAISIGTAMGCLQDTEAFLAKMTEQNEQMLTPTAFVQSTHNTVAGQIALVLGCNGHNLTYVHRGHSTEHALIDAFLYLDEHPDQVVLSGGIDELTDSSYTLMERAGVYSEAVAGEGAGFFLASLKQPEGPSVLLRHLFTCTDDNPGNAARKLLQQLKAVMPEAPELVLSGQTEDARYAAFYEAMEETFPGVAIGRFKEGTGEFATAAAVAVTQLLQSAIVGVFPSWWGADAVAAGGNIVVWNNYLDCYSCWVVEKNG